MKTFTIQKIKKFSDKFGEKLKGCKVERSVRAMMANCATFHITSIFPEPACGLTNDESPYARLFPKGDAFTFNTKLLFPSNFSFHYTQAVHLPHFP